MARTFGSERDRDWLTVSEIFPPAARCRVIQTDAHAKIISPTVWVVPRNKCCHLGDFAGRIARLLGRTYLRRSSFLPPRDRLVLDFLATNRRICFLNPLFPLIRRRENGITALFGFVPSASLSAGIQVNGDIFLRDPPNRSFFHLSKIVRCAGFSHNRSRTRFGRRRHSRPRARSTRLGSSIAAPIERFPRASEGHPPPPPRAPTADSIAPETRSMRRSLPAPRRTPVGRSRRRASLPREARPSPPPPRRFEARLRIGR